MVPVVAFDGDLFVYVLQAKNTYAEGTMCLGINGIYIKNSGADAIWMCALGNYLVLEIQEGY